jgi:hypothetical protein
VAWDESERRDVRVDDAVHAVKDAAATIAGRLLERERDREDQNSAAVGY